MDTRYIAAEYRLSHWAQIMRKRNESGQSISAFCRDSGIHENTYFYWQKKLREAACEQLAVIQSNSSETGIIQQKFTEVKLRDNMTQMTKTEPILQGNLSMEVSGVKIITDSSYPVGQLAYLLRELVKQC